VSIGGGHEALRSSVLERDNYECQMRLAGCTGVATTTNHIRQRARGGRSTLDNYEAACVHCNSVDGGRLGAKIKRAARRHPFFG
jgi:5-methylcytosine-specific restriction endonuclease McrA